MSISELGSASHVIGSAHRRPADGRDSFARFKVGQHLDLHVQERLAANRYVVRFGGTRHIVESAMALTAGATFAVTVAAIGDKLELRCIAPQALGTGSPTDAATPRGTTRGHEDAGSELLDATAAEFGITLSDADHAVAAAAMRDAASPRDMANSALFLSKLDMPVEPAALRAVYSALTWRNPAFGSGSEPRETSFAPESASVASVANQLDEAFTASARMQASMTDAMPSPSMRSHGEDEERRLAHDLLNTQAEEGVAYAYGSLPVLIANQLVELDVVLFRDRQSAAVSSALRRLVMTLKTENLGRVEIAAQALGSRLTIAIKTETAAASVAISRQADEVRELVTQLGWHIESIDFDIDPLRTRAAREILGHVLKSGTLDRLV
jgi:hypothetical protein